MVLVGTANKILTSRAPRGGGGKGRREGGEERGNGGEQRGGGGGEEEAGGRKEGGETGAGGREREDGRKGRWMQSSVAKVATSWVARSGGLGFRSVIGVDARVEQVEVVVESGSNPAVVVVVASAPCARLER